MESVLHRLREEREQSQDQWFSAGMNAARDWVEHEAPYAGLRLLGQASPVERIRLLQDDPPPYLSASLKSQSNAAGFSETSFLQGWSHMIGLLWEVIKKNL